MKKPTRATRPRHQSYQRWNRFHHHGKGTHSSKWSPTSKFCPRCGNLLNLGRNKKHELMLACPACNHNEIVKDDSDVELVISEKFMKDGVEKTEVLDHPIDATKAKVTQDERDAWDHLHADH